MTSARVNCHGKSGKITCYNTKSEVIRQTVIRRLNMSMSSSRRCLQHIWSICCIQRPLCFYFLNLYNFFMPELNEIQCDCKTWNFTTFNFKQKQESQIILLASLCFLNGFVWYFRERKRCLLRVATNCKSQFFIHEDSVPIATINQAIQPW